MFLPFRFRDTSSDVSECSDAFFLAGEPVSTQGTRSARFGPSVGRLIILNPLVTGNPTELGSPACLAVLSFCAEDPSSEPLARTWVVVFYPFERGLGVGKDSD
jgi:hypothetical protein